MSRWQEQRRALIMTHMIAGTVRATSPVVMKQPLQ